MSRLWDARRLTIGMTYVGCALMPLELMALALYSNNPTVANLLNSNSTEHKLREPYLHLLHTTLCKLPVYEGEVYVGAPEADRRLYKEGSVIQWPRFASSSTLWRVALENCPSFTSKARKGVVFVVKSKSGRSISAYSQFPFDNEVVFLPGTQFQVTRWYHGDVIALGQANIRENTFGVKERDDERMCVADLTASEKSLIIELTEMQ